MTCKPRSKTDRRKGERRYIGGENPLGFERRSGDRRLGERRKKKKLI